MLTTPHDLLPAPPRAILLRAACQLRTHYINFQSPLNNENTRYPCAEVNKEFKMVTAEHETRCGLLSAGPHVAAQVTRLGRWLCPLTVIDKSVKLFKEVQSVPVYSQKRQHG